MDPAFTVTAHDASERYSAADYPAQSEPGLGIPSSIAANRRLAQSDVVFWYTGGMNRIVRPEDRPVMPVQRAGFGPKPWGFFDRNPGLDIPMPDHCVHEASHGSDSHG